jgi:pentose-5-phosphate-3-epimerase
VLIRDRSKLVSLAVLESPKVNESEMESFAAMKNVQETVLRAISTKRNYIKNYGVLRALVNNPKTPLDAALPLLAHLLVKDLRSLAINKNVNETIRKLALKMFRTKVERKRD